MIVQSEHWNRFFAQYIDAKRLFILPNSVDVERFIWANRSFVPGKCEVLFMGGDEAVRKGLKDIASIVPSTLEANPNITFHLVGDPADILPVVPEKARVRLRVSPRLDGEDLVKAYHEADIFVLPSYGEGFPNTMLEAMAAGLPIISTPVGAIPEVIEEGRNGFIIEPGDRVALKNHILSLTEDTKSRRQISMNNVKDVNRRYGREEVLGTLEHLYSALT
jgi:glycosyltransferase involved in cell wall biosynthesis